MKTPNSPVLLNFHGFGGNAKDYINYESDFRDVAEQEGVILVYPQGSLLSGFSHWNAAPMAEDNKSNTDDIGFIELLIRKSFNKTYPLTPIAFTQLVFPMVVCLAMLWDALRRV